MTTRFQTDSKGRQWILKDPDARDIQTITLSYTFYPVDSAKTSS